MLSMAINRIMHYLYFVMIRRPPRSTRTDTLFPDTTLFRSLCQLQRGRDPVALADAGDHRFARIPRLRPVLCLPFARRHDAGVLRSEEHTSELQSLMRISYAVFCLKKKNLKSKSLYYLFIRVHTTIYLLSIPHFSVHSY